MFDEFISSRKDYILRCLNTINVDDIYSFLLQCFHNRIIDYKELVPLITSINPQSWTFYYSVTKSLLWVGLRDYVDANKPLLDEVYKEAGAAWYLIADIYHGRTLNVEEMLNSLPLINDDFKVLSKRIAGQLTPKNDVFIPVKQLFSTSSLPDYTPKSISEWKAFSELLFWLSQTDNVAVDFDFVKEENFDFPFKTLAVDDVALLMLGMHHYSTELNQIRLNLAHIFNHRLQEEYCIPLLGISDEIDIHVVINILDEEQSSKFMIE